MPFKEADLWLGYPEETNAPYGIAKKALLVQLQAYCQQYGFDGIYLLPVNLYGSEDNFDTRSSDVIPALIRKVHEAQLARENVILVWGDGSPTREFLYSEDAAGGIVMGNGYSHEDPVNLRTNTEILIKALIELICKLMEYEGEIVWETEQPACLTQVPESLAMQAFFDTSSKLVLDCIDRLKTLIFRAEEI